MKINDKLAISQYNNWKKSNPIKKLSVTESLRLDKVMRGNIAKERKFLKSLQPRELMLLYKWLEIRKKLKTYDEKLVKKVKSKMWIPHDRSDFRRIVPHMILVSDQFSLEKKNIFGEINSDTYDFDRDLIKVWQILRDFISSSRNDGTVGRQLYYLVIDKITQNYLGIICISGALPNLTPFNNSVYLTHAMHQKQWKVGGSLSRNIANGQTIMSCQPFGSMFNGGKLLSLLCSSKQVADDWKATYGDTLVCVQTTSLYGLSANSQYDGLRPFWEKLGITTGQTPLKPSDKIYRQMREWLRRRYPQDYHFLTLAKTKEGQNAVREQKNQFITKCYRLLNIKEQKYVTDKSGKIKVFTSPSEADAYLEAQKIQGEVIKYKQGYAIKLTGDIRGVYISRLYKNTDQYLRGEITDKDLVPAFNNSIEFLTEFWKFGYDGDTKSYVHPEIKALFKTEYRLEKTSSAKRRLQSQINRFTDKQKDKINALLQEEWSWESIDKLVEEMHKLDVGHRLPIDYDWYVPMANLTWAQVKERYAYLLKSD